MADEEKKARNKILEKIRNLLDLSRNNPSQAEAELAALRVAEMLEKYKLSMEDVESESSAFERDVLDFHHEIEPWEALLTQAICWNCFARAGRYGPNHILIVGKRHDLEIAKFLVDYLHRSIRNLAASREWNAGSLAGLPEVQASHAEFLTGFKMGAATNIALRLREARLRRERERAAQQNEAGNAGNALIKREDAALDQHMQSTYGEAKPPVENASNVGSRMGQFAGYMAADSIPLRQAVRGGAPPPPPTRRALGPETAADSFRAQLRDAMRRAQRDIKDL